MRAQNINSPRTRYALLRKNDRKMKIEIYNKIPQSAIDIRRKVFIEEQGFLNEFDKVDEIATHFVAVNDMGLPIATCRVFFDKEKGVSVIGRFAVLQSERGKSVGKFIVASVEEYLRKQGETALLVHAQLRATPFYQKVGFTSYGERDYDEGVEHIWMKKKI